MMRMPSACTKPEKKPSTEMETPLKQALNLVEKKMRNLEKRKLRLDAYREKGDALNADQREAVGRYDAVVQSLELTKEFQKQFLGLQGDAEKQQKKQLKRESHERQQVEIRRVGELLSVQSLLDSMGSEDVRADFVAGSKGAVKLTEEELDKLDELYKLISPTRDEENDYSEQLSSASEHIVSFLDGREKPVIGTTYKDLKAIVEKITQCAYFDKKEEGEEDESAVAVADDATAAEEEVVSESMPEQNSATTEQDVQEVEEEKANTSDETNSSPEFSQESTTTATEPLPSAALSGLEFTDDDPATASMLGQQQGVIDAANSNAAVTDETFFSTQPQAFPQARRPFNEIITSVQGTFDFLQDSHIDQVKAAAGQIEANSEQMGNFQQSAATTLLPDTNAAASAGQSQAQYQTQQTAPAAASLQFTADQSSAAAPSQYNDDQTNLYTQSLITQPLQGSNSQYGSETQSFPADQAAGSSASFGAPADAQPQPIPMPGQYSTTTADQASAAAAAAHDKNTATSKFAMNPEADIFQSMYTGGSDQSSSTTQQPQSTAQQASTQQQTQAYSSQATAAGGAASEPKSSGGYSSQTAWSNSTEFQPQGYGSGGYNRRGGADRNNSASTGYRGGAPQRNGNGSMNGGGYRGGNNQRSAPGNQRNGGSGNRAGSYAGGRGGAAGGQQSYKGYPPRNDYQPEGGYQGSYTSSGFMQSAASTAQVQGGPRGGPRATSQRGGRGGNYGNNRM